MTLIRVVYPVIDGWKLLRIYDLLPTEKLAVGPTCTKMMAEDWDASVTAAGGLEQDYIDALGVTEVQDMR